MSYNLYDELAEYFGGINDIDELMKEHYELGVFIQECVNEQEDKINNEIEMKGGNE
jgi:hypothetical protein